MFFLTETKSQAVLTAWNGRQWSQPQAQEILSGFEEPEIFTEVIYGCHRASLLGKRLYVVGCDEGGHGDVWVTSRDLGSKGPGLRHRCGASHPPLQVIIRGWMQFSWSPRVMI